MPDISSLPSFLLFVLPLAGIAAVVWAYAVTRQGRINEREARRLSEEAHRIKNDFVAMVSHELRTPLTSIAGFSDTLVDAWQDLPKEEVDEFLSIIHRQSNYLGDLVEDVLVIPRLEADRMRFKNELFDLGDLIEDVAEMVFPNGGRKTSLISLPTVSGLTRIAAASSRSSATSWTTPGSMVAIRSWSRASSSETSTWW